MCVVQILQFEEDEVEEALKAHLHKLCVRCRQAVSSHIHTHTHTTTTTHTHNTSQRKEQALYTERVLGDNWVVLASGGRSVQSVQVCRVAS